jgi:hypothetical protein
MHLHRKRLPLSPLRLYAQGLNKQISLGLDCSPYSGRRKEVADSTGPVDFGGGFSKVKFRRSVLSNSLCVRLLYMVLLHSHEEYVFCLLTCLPLSASRQFEELKVELQRKGFEVRNCFLIEVQSSRSRKPRIWP